MGAMIVIRYNSVTVVRAQIEALSKNLKPLVEQVIGESDVFVYADASSVAVGIEPIEVFIQVNERKTSDPDKLTNDIAEMLSKWKRQNNFEQPINLNVIPVQWHYKIGI